MSELFDIQTEELVIDYVLGNPRNIYRLGGLKPDHFSDIIYQTIFTKMLEFDADNKLTLDAIRIFFANDKSIHDFIIEKSLNGIAGTLWGNDASTAVNQLIELAHKRTARDMLNELVKELSNNPDLSHAEVISRLSSYALKADDNQPNDALPLLEGMKLCVEELKQRKDSNNSPAIKTGLSWLDSILGGIYPSDLIVIGARPSMGKTALALTLSLNAGRKGNTVLFFSIEMTPDQLNQRALSMLSGVNCSTRRDNINNWDIERFESTLTDLESLNVFVDGTENLTLSNLRRKAMRFKLQHQKLDLIVIDYLQLMKPESSKSKPENRVQEISAITRGVKLLAKELSTPIVLLSQLSRDGEKEKLKKGEISVPRLHHLRDSGSIEQDADVVLLLAGKDYSESEEIVPNIRQISIHIAKNRHGNKGKCEVDFNGPLTLFKDLS